MLRLVSGGGGGTKPAGEILQRNNTSYPAKVTEKLRKLYHEFVALRGDLSSERARWAAALKYYQFLTREIISNPEYGISAPDSGGRKADSGVSRNAGFGVTSGVTAPSRGLLLYKTMGMGKSIEGVALALSIIDEFQPVIMLPHSLEANFTRSIAKALAMVFGADVGAELAKKFQQRFTFISLDAYNAADQVVKRVNTLDGKFVIVDEAHDFFRAIINSGRQPTNARRIYEMIMDAKNIRIAFLTGTPCSKDPFELVPCFNMLAGYDLLPVQHEMFYDMFVDSARNTVKNPELLMNRLVGMVSHASHHLPVVPALQDRKGASPGDQAPSLIRADGGFPEELPTEIVRVEMSKSQYRQYLLAREKEKAEGKGDGRFERRERIAAPLALPGAERKAASSYYVRSRSISNYAPPRGVSPYIPVASYPETAFAPETSPKIARVVELLAKEERMTILYSQFVEVGGLAVVARFLAAAGYTEFRPTHPDGKTKNKSGGDLDDSIAGSQDGVAGSQDGIAGSQDGIAGSQDGVAGSQDNKDQGGASKLRVSPRFAIISGEVSEESRAAIEKLANDPGNSRGELLRVLLVSKTGAQGLDLKCFRRTIQLEPYWDMARDAQFKARANRLGSHDRLPPEERDVKPYLFIATANKEMLANIPPEEREAQTVDEMFHERAAKHFRLNEAFRKLLRSVSIECSLFGYGDCRLCAPTGAPLFRGDPGQDLKLADPCVLIEAKRVKATPIEVEGATFHYLADPAEPLGYRFFERRDDLGGIAPMDRADPRVRAILRALGENMEFPI